MNIASHPSTAAILWRLARKDWHLVRWPMLGYAAVCMVALGLFTIESRMAFHTALVLLLSVMVTIGAQLVFASVAGEKTNDTLPFMLSLPLTYVQYTMGKFLFAGGVFTIAWLGLLLGVTALVATQPHLPGGWMPFDLIIMGYLFLCFMLTLCVAMISESNAWTIVTMSVCNIGISIVMFAVATHPDIGPYIEGPEAVWNGTVFTLLGAELTVITGLFVLTLVIQSRKTDFL